MTLSDTLVQSSWARIDTWLRRNAPVTFAELAPPAAPGEIAAAQAELGVRFPAELLESLACHNGAERYSGVLPDNAPLSVAEMVELWRLRVEISNEDDDPQESFDEDEPWWHPEWIPWAATDGHVQVIDMRTGPEQGRIGSAPHDDSGQFGDGLGWSSLGAYLHQVAEALEFGGTVSELSPYLTPDGELRWVFPGEEAAEDEDLRPAPTAWTRSAQGRPNT
ncbi:SMI1/KNR4 family protein [Streptomyces sp. NPDC051362]|uniref:SMI1/KNR4 family protein n=1 Tax=Streptomyces sp. NPDC051362 TaxID=3365651 RepID=UPI0037A41CDF